MRKLKIELVPDGCWHTNLRYVLTKKQWEYISKTVRNNAKGKCSICGKNTTMLDAHEVWEYNTEKGVQKLKDVIPVCKACHSVIHIDYTALKGNIEKAEKHYMQVNGCSYVEYKEDLRKAHELHSALNRVSDWKLDIYEYLKKFLDE